MQTARLSTGIIHSAIGCATALVLCGAPSALAQEKQKIAYKVTAENSKYTQRNTIDVGDESGHQLTLFEIHRTFPSNAPVINGIKLKETFTRGYATTATSSTVIRAQWARPMQRGSVRPQASARSLAAPVNSPR